MKQLFTFVLLASTLSACSPLPQTMRILRCNRWEIERNTQAIDENTAAIEAANSSIEKNSQELEDINYALIKAAE